MRLFLLTFGLVALMCSACVRGAFSPVNVGREYGNPTLPWMVSHLPKKNQWVLTRTGPHYFLKQIICFDYGCRKMIGRRKALKAISFEDFKRQIRKNAKKGVYKKPSPAIKLKRDSIPVKMDTATIAPAPAVSAPTIAVPADAAPILKSDSLITLDDLLFETNSYILKEKHLAALDSLGKFLRAHPSLEISVSGYTDNTGSERHNVTLSLRRAEVVAEYLVDHGATFERVTYEGFGSAHPMASNDSEEGRSKNRRVEILIRNPKEK